MGWTTGRTTAQMVTTLVAAGALTDQALSALHSGAWKPNVVVELWGILVQCTSGWNNPGDATWEYDSAPSLGTTGASLASTAAALVTAGAKDTQQATCALHTLAWLPNQSSPMWGVLVKCTSGWDATANPLFSYQSAPS